MQQNNTLSFTSQFSIDPLKLAAIHESFDKKIADLENSYYCATGTKLDFTEGATNPDQVEKNKANFYGLFLASMYENNVKLKNKILFDCSTYLFSFHGIEPKHKPVKIKSTFDTIATFAGEKNCIRETDSIILDQQFIVSTDCYKLIAYKPENVSIENYDFLQQFRSISIKDTAKFIGLTEAQNKVNEVFNQYLEPSFFNSVECTAFSVTTGKESNPSFRKQWKNVCNFMNEGITPESTYTGKLVDLYNRVSMYADILKNIDKMYIRHFSIDFNGSILTFDIEHLLTTLKGLLSLSGENMLFNVNFYGINKALNFSSIDRRVNGLVMPIATNRPDLIQPDYFAPAVKQENFVCV
jgi:hypothetical protein